MNNNKNQGLMGLALFGAVMFGIGRCSVDDSPPQQVDAKPAALLAPAMADPAEATSTAAPAGDAGASDSADSPTPAVADAPEPIDDTVAVDTSLLESSQKSCGSKRLCRQMNSCAEAMHYLNDCGVGRLDGDGDGVPCESICG
jgi:hypothetical protein